MNAHTPDVDAAIREIRDRVRRTETRVTKVANHLGVDAGNEKPVLKVKLRELHITSRKCTLDELLAAVPAAERSGEGIDVYCGNDYIATVCWPD